MSAPRNAPAAEGLQPVPHDIAAEQAVIGACLIDRDTIVQLVARLEPEDFYVPDHVILWRTITELFHDRIPPDIVTVGGMVATNRQYRADHEYLVTLLQSTPTAVHAAYYARIVRTLSMRRQLIGLAAATSNMAYAADMPVPEVIGNIEAGVARIANRLNASAIVPVSAVAERLFDALGTGTEGPKILSGVRGLDNTLMGMTAGQLIVVAGRPGYGKSVLGLQIAYLAAKAGIRVAIANAEMSDDDTFLRLASRITGITRTQAHDPNLPAAQREQLAHAFGVLSELPLYLLDCWHQSLPLTLGTLRSAHAVEPFGLIVVDYIGLFQVPNDKRAASNRVAEVGLITRELKKLAREMGLPVVALAQLSRAVESRSGGRPVLSDLRESGNIEQDADVVVFLHRPDKIDADVPRGTMELIVAKHRGGPTGIVQAEAVDERFAIQDRQQSADDPYWK